jgi:hypothetical protein
MDVETSVASGDGGRKVGIAAKAGISQMGDAARGVADL